MCGIRCTEDLLNVNLKFLALSEMKEKENFKFPFTTYYGLLRARRTEWKSALRVTAGEHGESQKCETSLELFSTKEAYSTIIDKSFSAPTAEGRILNQRFTKEEIPNIYMLPFTLLKEPKLIMFQVRIIHNILPTQSSLFHARITDTDVCPLCNLESQSLKHMLITYSVSSSFWTSFSNWWQEKKPDFIWKHYFIPLAQSHITGKCLITVWLSPNIMFLLQVYAMECGTLTVFYCVLVTKLIFFAS